MEQPVRSPADHPAHTARNVFVVIITAALLGAAGWGAWYLNVQKRVASFQPTATKQPLRYDDGEIVEPKLDGVHARRKTIDAATGGAVRIVDGRGVEIVLLVPPQALERDTEISVVPFLNDGNPDSLDAGVAILPASVRFKQPVTVTFDLRGTDDRNSAPASLKEGTLRSTGLSRVYRYTTGGNRLVPALVARAAETETVIPARILSGGMYVYSLNSSRSEALARLSLSAGNTRSLTVMEAATGLITSGKRLSRQERTRADAAIKLILDKPEPPAPELFAAMALRQALEERAFSLVKPVHAADVNRGYLEYMCKRDLTLQEYVSLASTAQLLGHDDLGDACLVRAKNVVAERARDVLNDPSADATDTLLALQEVYQFGLDDESDLDENLERKVQDIVRDGAEETLRDPDATAIEIATQLQRMQGVGVEGDLHDRMEKRLKEAVEKEGSDAANQAVNDLPAISEEEMPLEGFDMSIVGLALAQALFGLESYDAEGIQKLADTLKEQGENAKLFSGAACDAIVGLGGDPPPECATYEADINRALIELDRVADEGAQELNSVQSREFEEEDFDSGIQLYLEPTESPEDAGMYYEEVSPEEPQDSTDYGYESNGGSAGDPVEDAGYEDYGDYGAESSEE
jgi:hypothetical protein